MAKSKNRRKKPAGAKKKKRPEKGRKRSQASKADTNASTPSEPYEEIDYNLDQGPGLLSGMRHLVAGGGESKEGFLAKRRSLSEWALLFGGLAALIYAIQYVINL